jgi:hypothetical protein
MCGNEPSGSIKCGKFLDYPRTGQLLQKEGQSSDQGTSDRPGIWHTMGRRELLAGFVKKTLRKETASKEHVVYSRWKKSIAVGLKNRTRGRGLQLSGSRQEEMAISSEHDNKPLMQQPFILNHKHLKNI